MLKNRDFCSILDKNAKMFEHKKNRFRLVQRIGNLVDLEKRCNMTIWLQHFASIQPRTSPLKFDHLAEKSEKDSVSNLAPKTRAASACRERARAHVLARAEALRKVASSGPGRAGQYGRRGARRFQARGR